MTPRPVQEPTFLILTALAAKPLHGYGLIKEVETLSQGAVQLRTGTLYGALDRLEAEGLIEVDREEVVDSRLRRYYRLRAEGETTLATEAHRRRSQASVALRRLRTAEQPG